MSKSEERRERIAAFLKRVDALSDSERTVLRKSGGRLLKDADAAALMVFYKALGNFEEPAFQDRMFPIACMYCMWDKETAQEDQTPLAAAMGQYASEKRRREGSVKWDESEKTDPMERRLIKLLDQRWDTDGILCLSVWRMVKMLKNEGKVINMVFLGEDFCLWNAGSKSVQCRWAEEFYRANKEEEKNVD